MTESIASSKSNPNALKQLLLSILIPTRNRARFLSYAIQSALNVSSDEIEILVSENYGSDDGWDVAQSFSDPRLRVIRPEKPLAMHENFEFLLNQSSGRWVTFIGDDDAVMPHCAEYLAFIEKKFPDAEAIVSPRAYYFWPEAEGRRSQPRCFFAASHEERWIDSKRQLENCLDGFIDYIMLPQIYGGGFQHRSLINRVYRLQHGMYFRSVTPDAYSAVMASLHTFRYLQVGLPLTWIGTSPSQVTHGTQLSNVIKDRFADFYGMHSEETLVVNRALGSGISYWPFLIHFYEAYIAAAPFSSIGSFSWPRVRKIFSIACFKLLSAGKGREALALAKTVGITPSKLVVLLLPQFVSQSVFMLLLVIKKIPRRVFWLMVSMRNNKDSSRLAINPFLYQFSLTGECCHDILSSDSIVARAFERYRNHYMH